MSADDADRKLLGLLDSLSPEHVERLKAPQTDGPETYLGVDVPAYMRPHWDSPQAMWWRAGVEAARQARRCAHCGGVIEPTGGHDWIGPVSTPDEPQKRYHLHPDFPDCRRASGACGTEGSEQ
ncbi:hypothetical protein [Streptomyces africanus]|uniref:hypothetical protein n=1 Tax=Streptomyces africanus TaxID=231024 RepID=UPI000A37B28C|nr:hypothetical protein [Streptomyces africanus]